MLYHVSPTPNLRTLTPRISSHHKPYVYVIDNLTTALLFGAKKDDFDFLLDTDDQNQPVLHECYPDAFRKIYQGKGCSVYEVEDKGFLRNITGWAPELVSETEVNVVREVTIPDLYACLLTEESAGRLMVYRYNQSPEYHRLIAGHIVDRLIRFDLLEHFDRVDIRGELYFRPLIDGLKALLDGHLLPDTISDNCIHNRNGEN